MVYNNECGESHNYLLKVASGKVYLVLDRLFGDAERLSDLVVGLSVEPAHTEYHTPPFRKILDSHTDKKLFFDCEISFIGKVIGKNIRKFRRYEAIRTVAPHMVDNGIASGAINIVIERIDVFESVSGVPDVGKNVLSQILGDGFVSEKESYEVFHASVQLSEEQVECLYITLCDTLSKLFIVRSNHT